METNAGGGRAEAGKGHQTTGAPLPHRPHIARGQWIGNLEGRLIPWGKSKPRKEWLSEGFKATGLDRLKKQELCIISLEE